MLSPSPPSLSTDQAGVSTLSSSTSGLITHSHTLNTLCASWQQ